MSNFFIRLRRAAARAIQGTSGAFVLMGALLGSAWLTATGAHAQTHAHSQILALLAAGQNRQALAEAQTALEASPRDPQLQFLKANAQLALGEIDAADATLTHLTQTYPELAEPWNNLASIRAGQGRLEEARQLLEQALRNNPDYAQAHANLASVLVQLAVGHLQTAEQLAPQPAQARTLVQLQEVARAYTAGVPPAAPR